MTRHDADVTSLERLVSVMLDFARLDARLDRAPLKRLDLAAVARVAFAEHRYDDRDLWVELVGTAEIDGYEGPLRMLIDNLLSNACRHARSQYRIELTVTQAHDVELTVEDDGSGFGTSDTSRLIRPFERGAPLAWVVLNWRLATVLGLPPWTAWLPGIRPISRSMSPRRWAVRGFPWCSRVARSRPLEPLIAVVG